jgi:nitrite reductase/ring-hydroxylating ferredoxin subunit
MTNNHEDLIPISRLLSRRRFCAFGVAGTGCALFAAVGGCGTDERSGLTTGPLDDAGVNLAGNDAPLRAPPITDQPDGAAGVVTTACAADGALDVGAPSTFAAGAPTFVERGDAFVVRDGAGLYAVSATCTHQKCTLRLGAGGFVCPCHGARFTLTGSVTVGPATRGLPHLALCVLPNGNVGLDPATRVPTAQRLGV